MTLKCITTLGFLSLMVGCQTTTSLDSSVSANQPVASAIAVTRPQPSNDYPVAYSVLSTDAQQRTRVVNRLELIEPPPPPEGWFDKFKKLIGL